MGLLKYLPDSVQYVMVFTKCDKLKGAHDNDIGQHVQRCILVDGAYESIAKHTSRVIPVVFASSINFTGACSIWSHILHSLHHQVVITAESMNGGHSTLQ